MRWLRTERGERLSPLSVENGCGTEVAKAESQTQKQNNSEQHPNQSGKTDQGNEQRVRITADWFVVWMDLATYGKTGCYPPHPFPTGNLKFITLKNWSYL